MIEAKHKALSVSELNRRAKMLLETQLNQIWVEGEISNYSQPSSGHWYFSLKDHSAQIRCAMFRNRNLAVKFKPKAGMNVRVRGRVSLYEPRGDYQLIVEAMQAEGQGSLQQQFEDLKNKLSKEGLFDSEHKLPLPKFVQHIVVISSPTGAAVHDILTVLKRRNPAITVTLIPSLVQGEDAPQQLIKSLNQAEQLSAVDAVIIGRGGGSIEDLWAFNNEALARKIFSMRIPIISAVGHEIDFSIADFVADQRAATPSAAAELLSSDALKMQEQITDYKSRLIRGWTHIATRLKQHVGQSSKRLKHPGQKIMHWQQRTDICEQRLNNAIKSELNKRHSSLVFVKKRVEMSAPLKMISTAESKLASVTRRLEYATLQTLETNRQRLASSAAELDIVSPLSTLKRGYAIARDASGQIVKSIGTLGAGHRFSVQLSDGKVEATIVKTEATVPKHK